MNKCATFFKADQHKDYYNITLFSASSTTYGEWSCNIFLEINTSLKSLVGAQIAWYTVLSVLHNLYTNITNYNSTHWQPVTSLAAWELYKKTDNSSWVLIRNKISLICRTWDIFQFLLTCITYKVMTKLYLLQCEFNIPLQRRVFQGWLNASTLTTKLTTWENTHKTKWL